MITILFEIKTIKVAMISAKFSKTDYHLELLLGMQHIIM